MRITFVTPHQWQPSGGVYTIQRYAEHLAVRGHDVAVAVVKGDPRPLDGCKVVPLADAPDGDAVIWPADHPIGERPGGTPICYLQGYGTPGNPVVDRNLRSGVRTLAVARWLVDEAAGRGSPVEHVPLGLDRALWRPGPPAAQRPAAVAMMTHTTDWKGTADGLHAIDAARQQVDFELRLFGRDVEGHAVARLPHEDVARLLRYVAVFVCASWEEGFGLPGLEALACGAAVATTDTKGCRDYVRNGSALMVQPRDWRSLADAIAALVGDLDLRHRTATAGQAVADSFPSWPQSAGMFEAALRRLL